MVLSNVQIRQLLTPILKSFDIRYAALFGSVARGQGREDSDVDLLVDIGHPMGMISYMQFINQLEKTLNVSVDVVPLKNIQPSLKREIKDDIKVIYEKR